MLSGNFTTAISSIKTSRWRSFLTMLGIVIGISSVITVVSLGEGLKHQIIGQINQLGSDVITVRPGKLIGGSAGPGNLNYLALFSASTLTDSDVKAIQKLPSVQSVVPIDFVTSSISVSGQERDNIFVAGTSTSAASVLNQQVEFGSFFSTDDPDYHFAVIGSNIAHEMFGTLNPVGESFTIQGVDYIVRGVLAPTTGGLLSVGGTDFNSIVFIPYSGAKQLTSGQTNILQILAKTKGQDIERNVQDIKQTVLKSHAGQENFSVLKQYELLKIASGTLNIITTFISSIAAVSLLVGGIGIMDIMLVSVSERTREIGIRKAVGATNRQILSQFLVEGSALSITGGIIGILVSLGINFLLKTYTDFNPVITWQVVALAAGVSITVGVIFGVAPAVKAARKDPIDALRGE
jgi:putative ABC transport system permease protein